MTDRLTTERRSENMRRILSKDTKPEMIVRRLVYGMGFRYRVHATDLPGKPDLVFRARKKAIFVHGCFWHIHDSCREGRIPGSRVEYWLPKLNQTKLRDAKHTALLRESGWQVLVVWECEISQHSGIKERIRKFLEE
jgi:DNA mismatch endonuclease, patch repair protein